MPQAHRIILTASDADRTSFGCGASIRYTQPQVGQPNRDATTFAAGLTGDLSLTGSIPAGRAGGVWAGMAAAAGWTPR